MNEIALIQEHYASMVSTIPANRRGYLYLLNNWLVNDGMTFDLELGYEEIASANGFTDNPTKRDLEMVSFLSSLEGKIRAVPFFKFPSLAPVPYQDFDAIAKRTNGIITDFFLIYAAGGTFYRREKEKGLTNYSKYTPYAFKLSNLPQDELEKISENHRILAKNGLKLD